MNTTGDSLPAQALALAARMYEAARKGDFAILEHALQAGLPTNMTNEKGDTLVAGSCVKLSTVFTNQGVNS
jgi:hypothetical protein